MARCFGLRVSALRYYDQLGLLKPVGRKGNVRYYNRAELRKLTLIQRLHHQGMVNLVDTTTLLAEESARTRPTWHDVLTRTAHTLQERIDQLRAARLTLQHLLECPSEDPIRECPYLHQELDRTIDAALSTAPADQRQTDTSPTSIARPATRDSRS